MYMPLLTIIFSISSLMAMNDNQRNKRILNDLLSDQKIVLKNISETRDQFFNAASLMTQCNPDEFINDARKLIKEFEEKSPLFFLRECENVTCFLTRSINPEYRTYYAKCVSNALVKKISPKRSVRYAMYGPSLFFQDLVILCQALDKKPDARIHIDAIDPLFESYEKIRTILRKSPKIQLNDYIDCVEFYRKMSVRQIQQKDTLNIEETISSIESGIHQFLRYLRTTFPQATLSLSVHSSALNYCIYGVRNKLQLPDVFVAGDTGGEEGVEFVSLCKHLVTCKPEMYNCAFTKNDSNALIESVCIKNGKVRELSHIINK